MVRGRKETVLRRWRFPAACFAVAIGTIAMSGCSRFRVGPQADMVFPRLDSAREQYYYAAQIDEQTLVGRDEKQRRQRLRRVIAAYQTVLDHFPEDNLYTPLALASIGDCYYEMGEYRKAIRIFEAAKKRYPNYPFIHAQAEWKIGQALDRLGRKRRAKLHYKRCIDTFRHSQNDRIQVYVKLCMSRYIRPSVEGETR